ncbi:hypothetical protein SteCoe_21030 [Stentor coeruleus]|uniref:Uncharacterized protein n=1 Tax=Stentor coeruleus TaxID=5963 RepID=A0A1R2BQQ1_9CILI|nr:hypothetical protein SteCoe_21030 [Stentor coeruleus]
MDDIFQSTSSPSSKKKLSSSILNDIITTMKEELQSELNEMKEKYSFDFQLELPINNKKIIWVKVKSPKKLTEPSKCSF